MKGSLEESPRRSGGTSRENPGKHPDTTSRIISERFSKKNPGGTPENISKGGILKEIPGSIPNGIPKKNFWRNPLQNPEGIPDISKKQEEFRKKFLGKLLKQSRKKCR